MAVKNSAKAVKKPRGKSFVPGVSGNPHGRPKGAENRATKNAREAIARFVDGNADRLQGWLDEIARDDGAKAAVACFVDLIEYHVPKLARTEVTGKDGKDLIPPVVNVNFPKKP